MSRLVADPGGTYAFLRQEEYEFPAELLDAITEARVIFLPPVVLRESGPVEFEAVGDPPALSAFHERLSEVGDPTIEQVREFDRSPSAARLTDRQQAAVDVAASVGYYDVPRTGSITDVAAELDCSTSTAGELVRKAESRIVRDAVET
ncbi:helix-turn-helix domain-containing protein [Halobellus ruber]|uniref:Helix-turn-helix domain-containing protein n=1 Tax=Halobellus ruber TaxID=2761102 RepID=A0A7J9SL12_9EURY|nr:helix-turn-helix domain-containing protein [Halobellus ruber]MBB6647063.1 helix-turn-helix domain-containing protein [Halobellus ruber]